MRLLRALSVFLLALVVGSAAASAEERFITLASTTSTEQSGLFAYIVPIFKDATGIEVRVVAVGTGQALAIAARGDADALLVHDRVSEERFVAEGHGIDRRAVMVNDFVIVGPAADPAGIRGLSIAADAMSRIAAAGAVFVSRGDDSGTHRKERRIWEGALLNPGPEDDWYRETGSGMGQTLNTAAGLDGYALTDRATFASFNNRQSLEILVEGDRSLLNPYSSILVNPERFPHVKIDDARAWHEWLTGSDGQAAIASFRIDGKQVFFPDAGP